MSYVGARLTAAALRSVGVNAVPSPDSDALTLELAGEHSSGEECLPHRITLGNFLKVTRRADFDARTTAFFMPTAEGPCRFGQYAPYLRNTLNKLGCEDLMIFSPSSRDSYDGMQVPGTHLHLIIWIAIVLSDLLTRFLLKTRPYEINRGDSDAVFEQSLEELCVCLARPKGSARACLLESVGQVERMRDRFRGVAAGYTRGKPLIGLVGEIFCRQDSFSNDDIARRIEKLGGECWLSDIAEWIWYTNWSQECDIRRNHGRLCGRFLRARIKTHVQHNYEQALLAPVAADLVGYEEPGSVRDILRRSEPYLPSTGCLGEMVLSVGKTVYLVEKGASGVIDISPFTCMNGIICEAVYPAVSADHARFPIRVCYFDGINTHIDRDLAIFLDLARGYQERSHVPRRYPDYFR